MIVYFRLLAGFTSFRSNLCFDHFSASGPEGILRIEVHRTHPARTAIGKEQLPTTMSSAKPRAARRAHRL